MVIHNLWLIRTSLLTRHHLKKSIPILLYNCTYLCTCHWHNLIQNRHHTAFWEYCTFHQPVSYTLYNIRTGLLCPSRPGISRASSGTPSYNSGTPPGKCHWPMPVARSPRVELWGAHTPPSLTLCAICNDPRVWILMENVMENVIVFS